MKEMLEILRELRGLEWPSKRGGIVYAFGIFLLSSAVITILAKTGIVLSTYWIIGVLLGLQLIHVIIWFVKRNFFYDPSALTIAFAVATEETSQLSTPCGLAACPLKGVVGGYPPTRGSVIAVQCRYYGEHRNWYLALVP